MRDKSAGWSAADCARTTELTALAVWRLAQRRRGDLEWWAEHVAMIDTARRVRSRRRVELFTDPYVAVDLRLLQHDSLLPFDLYQRLNGMYVLYRHRERPFDELTRSRLLGNGIDRLWVTDEDASALGRYFEQHLASVIRDRTIPSAKRAGVAQAAIYSLAVDLLAKPEVTIERAISLVEHLTRFTAVESQAMLDLISCLESRGSLAAHSANTGVFALALALATGTDDPMVMAKAAIAGFVHDVGLTGIDEAIIEKPAALDMAERERVQAHPRLGAARLRRIEGMPEDVCDVVDTHHERLDSSGYPAGLRAADISPLARIVSVAEVFDSLTSDQPWRKRYKAFDAAKLMLTEMPGLDERFVRLMVMALRS